MSKIVPFERYAGLDPLFLEFVRQRPSYYPDPPTVEAAAERAKELLGRKARVSAEAFRGRGEKARGMAGDLAAGRAVAVLAGHQVGLFTGPLFTLLKAFDAQRVARQLTDRGVPAVPVFYALTDDHDLEEVARTARPGAEAPEILILEGADRSNRQPVGALPIPARVGEILEAFRADAKAPDAPEILDAFARRYRAGTTYGEAFQETLLDLVDEPLLILDPMHPDARSAAAELFGQAAERRQEVDRVLADGDARLSRDGRKVPAPHRPGVFPFFAVDASGRRRVEEIDRAAAEIRSGRAWASADVLSRPVLKSFLVPAAASVLGPSEIAYHAQALPLLAAFGLLAPVLLPRSHVLWTGPPERRAIASLGLRLEDLLTDPPPAAPPRTPEAARLAEIARRAEEELTSLGPALERVDPTLTGALETTRRKVAYQIAQLEEKMQKATERKDEVTAKRRQRLSVMLRPQGTNADRLYPPLVPMLGYGRDALRALRQAATGSTQGVTVAELAAAPEEVEEAAGAR